MVIMVRVRSQCTVALPPIAFYRALSSIGRVPVDDDDHDDNTAYLR